MNKKVLSGILFSAIILPGCNSSRINSTDISDLVRTLLVELQVWTVRVREPVVARIDGHRITKSDLDAMCKKMNKPCTADDINERRHVLSTIIRQEIPVIIAEKAGYETENSYVEKMADSRRYYLTERLRKQMDLQGPVNADEIASWTKTHAPAASGVHSKRLPLDLTPEGIRAQIAFLKWNQWLNTLMSSMNIWIQSEPVPIKRRVVERKK